MDLTNSTVKTPEAETETPTPIHPFNKSTPFNTNGVLKRHAPLHHHPVVVTYKECLRNHAASLGGHAVDGCGEFMPSPTTNPTDPSSLKCAACGCHRNFHRREPDNTLHHLPPPSTTPALEYHPHHRHHPPPPPRVESGDSPNNSPSPPPISSAYYPSAPHMLLANSHSMSAPPPPDAPTAAAPVFTPPNTNSTPIFSSGSGRKRFRTRFTQEQKEKMLELAERVGWKMQKRDEDVITEFCSKIGVEKGVFKVWMHNNKHNFGKKDQISPGNGTAIFTPPLTATGNGSTVSYNNIGYLQEGNREIKDNFHGQELNQNQLGNNNNNNNNNNRTHLQVLGANGSSSSC